MLTYEGEPNGFKSKVTWDEFARAYLDEAERNAPTAAPAEMVLTKEKMQALRKHIGL